MITEIGHFALVLALAVAAYQTIVPQWGRRNDGTLMSSASAAAVLQLLLLSVSFAALTHAYVTSDFSVLNVAENSHSDKPMLYKISGVWGNHEARCCSGFSSSHCCAAVAVFGRNLPETTKARILSVQGSVGLAFLVFVTAVSNPFLCLLPPPWKAMVSIRSCRIPPGLSICPSSTRAMSAFHCLLLCRRCLD